MDLVAVVGTQSFQGKTPGRSLGRTNTVQLLNPSSLLMTVARRIRLKQAVIFLLFPLQFLSNSPYHFPFPYEI